MSVALMVVLTVLMSVANPIQYVASQFSLATAPSQAKASGVNTSSHYQIVKLPSPLIRQVWASNSPPPLPSNYSQLVWDDFDNGSLGPFWTTVNDAVNNNSIAVSGSNLTITAGALSDLNGTGSLGPLVLSANPVNSDYVFQAKSSWDGNSAGTRGFGIIAFADFENWVSIEMDPEGRFAVLERHLGGYTATWNSSSLNPAYMMINRTGGYYTFAISADGSSWSPLTAGTTYDYLANATLGMYTRSWGDSLSADFDWASISVYSAPPPSPPSGKVWVDDAFPNGSTDYGDNYGWVGSPVYNGSLSWRQSCASAGLCQSGFSGATDQVNTTEYRYITTMVNIDPGNQPNEILLQFNTGTIAYWGNDTIAPYWGYPTEFYEGPLPAPGHWAALTISLDDISVPTGTFLTGMSVTTAGVNPVNTYLDYIVASASILPPTSQFSITIDTAPSGLNVQVDGVNVTTPDTFTWDNQSSHEIAALANSCGTGCQHEFDHWSDAGAQIHNITVTENATYTATLVVQYYLTMESSPTNGGSTSPPSGWYNESSVVAINVTTAPHYNFTSWTGIGAGSYNGTDQATTVTMDGPINETASFVGQYIGAIVVDRVNATYRLGEAIGYNVSGLHHFDTTTLCLWLGGGCIAGPTTDANGNATGSFPLGVDQFDALGSDLLFVADSHGVTGAAGVTVIQGLTLTTDDSTYRIGDTIVFHGSGFTPGSNASLCITTDNHFPGICVLPGPTVDSSGDIFGLFTVGDNIPLGAQKLVVTDLSTGLIVFQQLMIVHDHVPQISLPGGRTLWSRGDIIDFTGTSFTANSTALPCMTIDNDGTLVCAYPVMNTTSSGGVSGSFQVGFNIPVGPQKLMVADQGRNLWAIAPVQVFEDPPLVHTDNDTYHLGDTIHFSGGNFTWGGDTYACLTTNDSLIQICQPGPTPDSAGLINGTYTIGFEFALGPQKFTVFDLVTHRSSILTLTLLAGTNPCPTCEVYGNGIVHVTGAPPAVTSIQIDTAPSANANLTSIDVDTYYRIKVNITDPSTLASIQRLELRVYTTATSWALFNDSERREAYSWDYTMTWQQLGNSGWTAPDGVYFQSGASSVPNLAGTSGVWVFQVKLPKVSHYTTGDGWNIIVDVTDKNNAGATRNNFFDVHLYLNLVVPSTIDWSVPAGSINATAQNMPMIISYTSNAVMKLRTSATVPTSQFGDTIPTSDLLISDATPPNSGLYVQTLSTSLTDWHPGLGVTDGGVLVHAYWFVTVPAGQPTGAYVFTYTFDAAFQAYAT